jgi:hypothetical protein
MTKARRKRKRKLTPLQAHYVDTWTEAILRRLLEFRLECDVANYFIENARADWRRTQDTLNINFPVKGYGVIFRTWDPPVTALVEQVISPEKAIDCLGAFPLQAAAINYVFTLLEIYGDLVVWKTNAKFFSKKRAYTNWHHKIHGDANTERQDIQLKLANALGEPLLVNGSEVDLSAALKLVELKRARNGFAHGADTDYRFDVLWIRNRRHSGNVLSAS